MVRHGGKLIPASECMNHRLFISRGRLEYMIHDKSTLVHANMLILFVGQHQDVKV
jgi:hypothetical protein